MIPNKGPKIQSPLRRGTLQLISLAIHGGYQKTIQGPQPPGPAGIGLAVQFRVIQRGTSQGCYIISISFQGSKYFSIPWKIQLVHTGNTPVSCMALAQLGPIHSHCGNSVQQSSFRDGQNCMGPIQTIQPVTYLPGSAFQLFTYTGHLSSPGDFLAS
ncbi:hypothetical protein O181_132481 [Austropuccinia psidii MF-1]|uniref:Uncharacterized protein n=1 Tax=Austropuccinia psidii MF-1 TaxID=1389203 RepID=A0A9Q3L6G7_9BASI|nr:hypothetical protein [Austropuccinia psidii MF-1]